MNLIKNNIIVSEHRLSQYLETGGAVAAVNYKFQPKNHSRVDRCTVRFFENLIANFYSSTINNTVLFLLEYDYGESY